jgi:hypothetical protein
MAFAVGMIADGNDYKQAVNAALQAQRPGAENLGPYHGSTDTWTVKADGGIYFFHCYKADSGPVCKLLEEAPTPTPKPQ